MNSSSHHTPVLPEASFSPRGWNCRSRIGWLLPKGLTRTSTLSLGRVVRLRSFRDRGGFEDSFGFARDLKQFVQITKIDAKPDFQTTPKKYLLSDLEIAVQCFSKQTNQVEKYLLSGSRFAAQCFSNKRCKHKKYLLNESRFDEQGFSANNFRIKNKSK